MGRRARPTPTAPTSRAASAARTRASAPWSRGRQPRRASSRPKIWTRLSNPVQSCVLCCLRTVTRVYKCSLACTVVGAPRGTPDHDARGDERLLATRVSALYLAEAAERALRHSLDALERESRVSSSLLKRDESVRGFREVLHGRCEYYVGSVFLIGGGLPLDDGAKPNRLRKPLHCGVGVAGAPLPLGGRVRRGVVRDPARDLGGKQGR